jgi:hypothetical protein
MRLHPGDSKPTQVGATALATLGEHGRAREWLDRALAIDPDDNGTRCNAVCVSALLGEPDRASDLPEVYLGSGGPRPEAVVQERLRSRYHPQPSALRQAARTCGVAGKTGLSLRITHCGTAFTQQCRLVPLPSDAVSSLRPHEGEGMLGAEHVAMQVGDPLSARCRHIQVCHGIPEVR